MSLSQYLKAFLIKPLAYLCRFRKLQRGIIKKMARYSNLKQFLFAITVCVSTAIVSTVSVSTAVSTITVVSTIVSSGFSIGLGCGFSSGFGISGPLAVVVGITVRTGISVSVVATMSQ